jgi:hypothetical protein
MLFATLTFWLLITVLAAWGIQQLWQPLLKPKIFHGLLLPGTLVAQIGHVLGLLITGAEVNNTSLYKDESGEPGTTQNARPKIPVIGPLVIGMLPLLACTTAIVAVAHFLGRPVLTGISSHPLTATLPMSRGAVWEFLRDQISTVEALVESTLAAGFGGWDQWLFLYLMVCLTVRMAPFPGNMRGSLGAIVVLGVVGTLVGTYAGPVANWVEGGWVILTLTVATLLLLLGASALVRGVVGLARMLAQRA